MSHEIGNLTRRAVLAGALSGAVAGSQAWPKARAGGPRGQKSFLWGVATAGHQIEGNNVNSDYWVMENVKPTLFAQRSGDACDSYHRFAEDIGLIATAGLNTYRFSLEWARIEPNEGQFSEASLDYYLPARRRLLSFKGHSAGRHLQPLHDSGLVCSQWRLVTSRRATDFRPLLRPGRTQDCPGHRARLCN